MKKKWLILVIVIAVLLVSSPIAAYMGIVVVNNGIANHVEKELKSYPLPADTIFLDSVSIAGKLVGNGNGMQYMGSVLVVSDWDQEQLYEYYSQAFDNVEVRKQESQVIDFIDQSGYNFELYGDPNHHDHYSITCWGSPADVGLDKLATVLVYMDLRGH